MTIKKDTLVSSLVPIGGVSVGEESLPFTVTGSGLFYVVEVIGNGEPGSTIVAVPVVMGDSGAFKPYDVGDK
jgi:hypothetical protein